MAPNQKDAVNFVINGTKYSVTASDAKLSPESRLVDYIREEAGLTGTKWNCREGGCGACVVSVRNKDPNTGEDTVRAVNSCLTPVYSCDGWDISTVEDLGNKRDGYHPIQKRLATLGGTQCGFCTSGMVMNMYSLSQSNKQLTSEDIENSLDGSICRCTGYRPIYDAFKSFTVDADPAILKKCQDIEELCATCPALNGNASSSGAANGTKNGSGCGGSCSRSSAAVQLKTNLELTTRDGAQWFKVTDLKTAFDTVNKLAASNIKYRVVAGNTGTGVYKYDGPYDAYVEVNSVPDLQVLSVNKSEAVIGGATTLSRAITFFQELSESEGFAYAAGMSKHILRVANTPVRNFGTIAGNIMMKHAHHDFPSDIFLLLETVGAKIHVASSPTSIRGYTPVELLKVDMSGKLIVFFTLPNRGESSNKSCSISNLLSKGKNSAGQYVFRSFKITKRYQNAHAYVNAGFLLKIDPSQNFKVVEKPTVTFGGIHPDFLHATATEEALTGAELGDPATLKKALKVLDSEVQPDHVLPDATPEYRKSLAKNLLYKVVLGIVGENVAENIKAGGEDLPRKLHTGKQIYDMDDDGSALYKPVPKLESLYQCSGEAEYVNDVPKQPKELAGVFVLATVGNATLKNVDATEALATPGAVAFITAKDIPGKNSFYNGFFVPGQDWIFAENKILSSGQAIGLIVAETREIAAAASKKVKVEYQDQRKPIVDMKEAVEVAKQNGSYDSSVLYPMTLKSPVEPNPSSKHVIKGEFRSGSQAHFHMETHVSLVIPKEDGYTVYSATQWLDHINMMIASALGIPNNSIDVQVRRLGGSYGGKAMCSTQVAVAAAIASHVTRRPVRVALSLEENFEMMGKRLPYLTEYEVGFDDNGKIDNLQAKVVCDTGMIDMDGTSMIAAMYMQSCYAINGWVVTPGRVTTNTPRNTFTRAPGTTQGISVIENIMEHIADVLKKDPLKVREANYLKPGDDLIPAHGIQEAGAKFEGENLVPTMIEEMKKNANYEERKAEADEFNQNNRWRKRGLAMVPMMYPQGNHGMKYPSFVAIHHDDGSVSVSHGGVECGQGINTKVAQVVAHELGIPLSKVAVKPSNNFVSANADTTGGAITSELVCYATMRSCQQLKERLGAVKKDSENLSWEELVAKAHQAGIDLRATHMYSANDSDIKPYRIWGVILIEVEADVLTGEYKISRLDIIEDAGKSLSPEVDIGQIEGSVVMGLGLWTEEKLVFHPETGRLLTRNTWEYKLPFPKCIPEEMNVTIMRNGSNPFGVLRSKATGEPPLCLSVAVLFAIKNAIKAARKDAGNTDYFELNGPVSPEDIVRLSLTDPSAHFSF